MPCNRCGSNDDRCQVTIASPTGAAPTALICFPCMLKLAVWLGWGDHLRNAADSVRVEVSDAVAELVNEVLINNEQPVGQ